MSGESQPEPNKRQLHRHRRQPQHEIFPNANDPNVRVFCNEIAEELSKNWRFKFHVGATVIASFIVLVAAIAGIVGWSVSAALTRERQAFEENAKRQLGTAKEAIERQIAVEFEKENVQKTVEAAVAAEAGRLLAKSVNPRIQEFEKTLKDASSEAERRSKDVEQVVKRTEEDASSIESLRGELERLKQRNDLRALADKAISDGDVEAYRQLESIVTDESKKEHVQAAVAELFRVYNAYCVFSGVKRTSAVSLDVHSINPNKTKEDELDANDLLPLLRKARNPIVRVKIAELLSGKVKPKSFKTAEALAEALTQETHLEGFMAIGTLLGRVTDHTTEGKLDKRELLQWYRENRERLKKEDTDATSAPTPGALTSVTVTPSASP